MLIMGEAMAMLMVGGLIYKKYNTEFLMRIKVKSGRKAPQKSRECKYVGNKSHQALLRKLYCAVCDNSSIIEAEMQRQSNNFRPQFSEESA